MNTTFRFLEPYTLELVVRNMSYSLNLFKGLNRGYTGTIVGIRVRVMNGDTRSLGYSSYEFRCNNQCARLRNVTSEWEKAKTSPNPWPRPNTRGMNVDSDDLEERRSMRPQQ